MAHLSFRKGTLLPELSVTVELAVDIRPVNPFDFFIDERCATVPFPYPAELTRELTPFLDRTDPDYATGPRFEALLASLPKGGPTVNYVIEVNRRVNQALKYVIREESGIWTPEETLTQGRGSCRDQAVLLIALLRAVGLAARFASGYLVQLQDEGMLPDEPRGVSRDVCDLHAWTEVFLPGGGWIGLDPTSGLLTGEGHIPLASVSRPAAGSPLDGSSDQPASEVAFSMKVGRLGHEVRPTAPFPEEAWSKLLAGADAADAALAAAGLHLTSGGEPTLNSREDTELPEWNGEALGPSKWAAGLKLARELKARLTPGAVTLRRQGKWYPGESLPRWALDLIGLADGTELWPDRPGSAVTPDLDAALRFVKALAAALGLPDGMARAGYEDPWRFIQDEYGLPVGVDPLKARLSDSEERRRLARILGGNPSAPVGYALPLARAKAAPGWQTERWRFRREHLFLIPGDSPMGLRLPLGALGGPPEVPVDEPALAVPDPRIAEIEKAKADKVKQARREAARAAKAAGLPAAAATLPDAPPPIGAEVRTALCVEPREGTLFVFLPPTGNAEDFLALVGAVDAARVATGLDVMLEGYPPPSSPRLVKLAVTPDPGVLEVNLPPISSGRAHAAVLDTVFEAGLHAGLHSEKWMLDGRLAGSGGGHHVTLGGPTALQSPMVVRPDLLASLVTFAQHHPSLSFLFTGLFVGPTSQAPRVDEARLDTLSDLEIALAEAFRATSPAPWLGDLLFRHLLTDLTGNTHRAEISIDKLFDWRTPHGRQGVVELRAFEMPPHPRLASAQALLARQLVAAFAKGPYKRPLIRWGAELHDRFLLPHWLWKDFEEVLGFLDERGLALPPEPYRAFVELRCPVAGRIEAGGPVLEVRNALEPWNVLGEEPGGSGTSRYVDASMERIEIRAEGIVPERHRVAVNGIQVPMRPTGTAGEMVGGVRFRAWAPAHALHPHLGIHHPLRIELVDAWGRRAVGSGTYHVWHPEGRGYQSQPLTRFEASARRAQRFTHDGAGPWPVVPRRVTVNPETPSTLDLRRHPGDRPMPDPEPDELDEA